MGTVLGISSVLIRMSFKKRIGKFCNAYFPRPPKKQTAGKALISTAACAHGYLQWHKPISGEKQQLTAVEGTR
jgi:hypothetical protein